VNSIFTPIAAILLVLYVIYLIITGFLERVYKKRCSIYIANGHRCLYLVKDSEMKDKCLSVFHRKRNFVGGRCTREKCDGFHIALLPSFSSQIDNCLPLRIIHRIMDHVPEIVAALLVLKELSEI